MSISALIRRMAEAGAPPEAIALAVEEIEAVQASLDARRTADRDRKRTQRERQISADVTGHSEDSPKTVTPNPSPFEVSPQTPIPKTPNQIAPLSPPKSGKKMIPEDWTPPARSELSPRARACAEQWSEASYLTEAEGFVLYWRSERKMRPDWKATWANRIIARHSAVMRDQKFGNGAPDIPKYTAPRSPEEALEWWTGQAVFYRKIGREDDAVRCEEHAKALEVANPELSNKVSSMVDRVTRGLRVSKARAA